MKFALSLAIVSFVFQSSLAAPFKRDVNPAQVPDFGLQSGLNPTGTGDCDGIRNAAGQIVKIPCACPPERGFFLQVSNSPTPAYPQAIDLIPF
jgi:hypothetical protein